MLFVVVILAVSAAGAESQAPTGLYVIPNFHPACMGWVAKYSVERNFCLNDYLAHLDRVAEDPEYKFAFSEIPHLITMIEFEPQRFKEFQQRIKEGRVEVVNAFVLEPTINLSGGEALVMQGVEGLRWYDQVMNLQPRYLWMIDIVGWHEQMAQIVNGLGLDAFLYVRNNPIVNKYTGPKSYFHKGWLAKSKSGKALHWMESPDGSRALAVNPGHYKDKDLINLFMATEPLTDNQLRQCIQQQICNRNRYPEGVPLLGLGGAHDYSLPFYCKAYPSQLIKDWNRLSPPDIPIQMATLSDFMDIVLPSIKSGEYQLETAEAGSKSYSLAAFWMQVPEIKQMYRRSEHALQASEALAAVASLKGSAPYPSQEFSNAWFLMCLNMDRNVLWGVLIDESYSDPESWDIVDRFAYVNEIAEKSNEDSLAKITEYDTDSLTIFNPVNWKTTGPFELQLPEGYHPVGIDWQWLEDGKTIIAQTELPSMGMKSLKLKSNPPRYYPESKLPSMIENEYYRAVVDSKTGNLTSLKLKPSGREMIHRAAAANVVVAQQRNPKPKNVSPRFGLAHNVSSYSYRKTVASSGTSKPTIYVQKGPLATIVDVREPFYGGGELRRVMRFYNDSPRIDFKTTTNGFPEGTIVAVEFPLVEKVVQMRRGIPYGFSQGPIANRDQVTEGATEKIIPVIRWADYEFAKGGGFAVLDRGVPAREFVDNKAIILLNNATGDEYYFRDSTIMADKREHTYSYAIIAHEQNWVQNNIPRDAWEYNSKVITYHGGSVSEPMSFVQTSDNVIVEALRRIDDEIEIRMVECKGKSDKVQICFDLPHNEVALTNLLGKERKVLKGGPDYTFDIRPQQIVTLRLKTNGSVNAVKALRNFDSVIPPIKLDYMKTFRKPEFIGHPGEYGRDWKPRKITHYPGGADRKEFEEPKK